MKKVCKVLCRIFGIFMWFILVNLIIWTIKYWWTKAYSQILNQKDRQQCVSEFSILKPKTRVSMFYKDSQENMESWLEESLINEANDETISEVDSILNEFLSWDIEDISDENVNHNPYDPDYEDEFNSFFWETSEEAPELVSVEEIEDLEPAWFVVDENAED